MDEKAEESLLGSADLEAVSGGSQCDVSRYECMSMARCSLSVEL